MQRYILNSTTKKFSDNDTHHIKNVMRMKTNDEVIVCFDEKSYLARLIINNNVEYEIIKELENDKSLNVTLIQGNLKGSKLETTIKYATIFGAKTIIIADFERSIAKVSNVDHKVNRYTQIAKEAAELSKKSYIPNIIMKESLKKIDFTEFDLVILADEEEHNQTINDIEISKYLNKKIAIVIGPEGGISNNERKLFSMENAKTITLGQYIYPAEIASIGLLSIIFNNSFDN